MTALSRRPQIVEEGDEEDLTPKIGQWYWYRHDVELRVEQAECSPSEWDAGTIWSKKAKGSPEIRTISRETETLVCVIDLGSNYAQAQGRQIKDDYRTATGWRIHFDRFAETTRRESDPQRVLDEGRLAAQRKLNALMDDVKEITRRLGLADSVALPAATDTTLATISDGTEPNRYKAELKLAKETTLPDLFKEIEIASADLSSWLTATMIPMRAQAAKGKEAIAQIDERIFSVELYAGLTEEVECVHEGTPAAYHEKIHLIQGLRYMDEECLVHYEAGGMDFKKISEFDKWLCKPHVFARLFPYPRTVCAFKVRRHQKDYNDEISLSPWICFVVGEWHTLNSKTFLYIRNGERLYRLATDVQFKERLFPNSSEQILASRQVWVDPSYNRVLSDEDYQALKDKEIAEYERKFAEWKAYKRSERKLSFAHAKTTKAYEKSHKRWKLAFFNAAEDCKDAGRVWTSQMKRDWLRKHPEPEEPKSLPYRSEPRENYTHRSYDRVDPDSVQYDDMMDKVRAAVKQYNKIAILLQGLLDRSPVLHPHPGWKLFSETGLQQAVTLVFDTDRAIVAGEAPDFEAYRTKLNAQLQLGDYTVGQQRYWGEQEAKKASFHQVGYRDYYKPYGNDGPGDVARVVALSRDKKTAHYEWMRERLRVPKRSWFRTKPISNEIKCHLSVPVDRLLNVSAYKPGDFHIFFDDPRTRQDYLQWAPMLLRAEDWHAERGRDANAEQSAVSKKRRKKKS